MATCPECGVHGYPPEAFALTEVDVFYAVPGLLGGSQPKVPARRGVELRCLSCGWSVQGYIGPDGKLWADRDEP